MTDNLLARLQALAPAAQAQLLAQLDIGTGAFATALRACLGWPVEALASGPLGVAPAPPPALAAQVLRTLADRRAQGAAKAVARWYRDLIMAAALGQDLDWADLRAQGLDVAGLQAELRAGLVALLADRDQPIPTHERVRAGFLLGDLGDPRVPVTAEAWRHAVERALSGDASGYFCRVAAGAYEIGSAADDPDARAEEQPLHQVRFAEPFHIARYPITNAQWAAWGAQPSERADDADLNRPNQPAVSLERAWCTTFCAWLSAQTGASIRLPTEQEWEAAARGGDARRYPWGDAWRADCAATEDGRTTRGWHGSVPVGCYPAGAAPCGALDMAGNVWEWTASIWQSYPGAAEGFTQAHHGVVRGGYYDSARTYARCGARDWWFRMGEVFDLSYGFRVVLAPPLAP